MAVRLLNQRRPGSRGVRFLWKLPRGKFDLSGVPPQVKFFEWLHDPLIVYEHSAVKACINHGGTFFATYVNVISFNRQFQAVILSTKLCNTEFLSWSALSGSIPSTMPWQQGPLASVCLPRTQDAFLVATFLTKSRDY